ncbi:hypothetical protein PAXRUDRAFT_28892 [Paxillus rubicundulus Ve08.2h10]|uniref:Uncharacterized protein n=1 Tax=Paxillus rubicundulus Ve08.2h10 TaxID=930991 RepID=A0A0D0C0X2_9AGAM|nr:hypothetical protein PAXRUDRAFT_28892 [Paxillus rubicundulus Ve08.2h10]
MTISLTKTKTIRIGCTFTFEVAKTNEQEEGVSVRPGFKCTSDQIIVPEPHPDSQMDPEFFKPRLVHGETRQGFMTARYLPGRRSVKDLRDYRMNSFQLQDALENESLQIAETIGPKLLHQLFRLGLGRCFPEEGDLWAKEMNVIKLAYQKQMENQKKRLDDALTEGESRTEHTMRVAITNAVFHDYPFVWTYPSDFPWLTLRTHSSLDHTLCLVSIPSLTNEEEELKAMEYYHRLTKSHPRIAENLTEELRRYSCDTISNADFRKLKEKSVLASILHEVSLPVKASLPSKPTSVEIRNAEKLLRDGSNESAHLTDEDFISDLENISRTVPTLGEALTAAKDMAPKHLGAIVEKVYKSLLKTTHRVQREDFTDHKPRLKLTAGITKIFSSTSPSLLRLKSVVPCKQHSYGRSPLIYAITGRRELLKEATRLFTIHPMRLTTQDQHELQLDPTTVPNPRFRESYSFQLPLGFSISHAQLLEGDRLLLALKTLERERGKMLHWDKIGEEFLLAFDESQRMLAVVGCEKNPQLQLHIFVHDASQGFTASGSTINLHSWFGEGEIIKKACFISGSEELLLVDSKPLPVFSPTTMQFRPVSMDLHHVPMSVYSSPDGSCFLAAITDGATTRITAHHWSTFGLDLRSHVVQARVSAHNLQANDWGALSQTMASHRAQLLLTLLPTALAFGLQDVEPEVEPLKNLDTDMPTDLPDTDARFFAANVEQLQNENAEELLDALLTGWVNSFLTPSGQRSSLSTWKI